ncbi:LysR substrate-binding domain-containing protein [Falsiroseomonas tokyonensis]|uniref:LysR substrate-binding domain-containing protein n=1 Tax=Falsiroseomonas tokyonensis TaxID=430521 RepID=A0ABV7BUZ9_9PROT|nr:LysR substrate-binding domain-containing protein [Falsiroseomonas tokyonensis]MBU8537870.1 LysR family transcriptional regulator [Falsiroseomonas tokyonensis]
MRRITLDLDILHSFVTGLELGSFARASEQVGRTQSAVSGQLRRLEAQFGRPLLRRQGRGLVLTEAGEILLGYAKRLLELNDEAVAAIRGADLEGWVRLGLPQDFAELWLPEMLGRFARAHPRLRVEVRAEGSGVLLERLDRGLLDLALVWGGQDRTAPIAEVPVAWLGPAEGALGWQAGTPVPLVAFEPPCQFRNAAVAALEAAGMSWRLAFSSPSLAGLRAAVAAGLGVTPRSALGLGHGVRALAPGEAGLPPLTAVPLTLVEGAEPAPAVALLARILRETLEVGLSAPG